MNRRTSVIPFANQPFGVGAIDTNVANLERNEASRNSSQSFLLSYAYPRETHNARDSFFFFQRQHTPRVDAISFSLDSTMFHSGKVI